MSRSDISEIKVRKRQKKNLPTNVTVFRNLPLLVDGVQPVHPQQWTVLPIYGPSPRGAIILNTTRSTRWRYRTPSSIIESIAVFKFTLKGGHRGGIMALEAVQGLVYVDRHQCTTFYIYFKQATTIFVLNLLSISVTTVRKRSTFTTKFNFMVTIDK